MQNQPNMMCPFCNMEILPAFDTVVCSQCKRRHHKACWTVNNGCSVDGCGSLEYTVDASVSEENAVEEVLVEESAVVGEEPQSPEGTEDDLPEEAREIPEDEALDATDSPSGSEEENFETDSLEPALVDHSDAKDTSADDSAPSDENEESSVIDSGEVESEPTADPLDDVADKASVKEKGEMPTEAELAPFIGKNVGYYLDAFRKLKGNPLGISWNFAAFFFAPWWFIYRGMMTHGIVLASFTIIVNAIKAYLDVPLIHRGIIYAAWLFAYVLIAAFANYAYLNKLKQYVTPSRIMPEELRVLYVKKSGGTRPRTAAALLFAYLLVDFLVRLIMYKLF